MKYMKIELSESNKRMLSDLRLATEKENKSMVIPKKYFGRKLK